ncbi:1-Phosphatidylinositol 4,5-Bisphosphate Phosphodiesterase Eta-1 [Manis pentadactyla]|nr:1-Phosphatidylinositol 4,5-Bisphosphate Phosphodiesterase Eta-1 [Manis pentadactyla]
MTNFGKHKKTTKSRCKSHSTDDEEDAQQNPGKETGQLYRLGRRRKTMKLCRELSDLVVYTNSVAAQDIVDDVALNYQSEGRMMQLNRAKFKTNGNCDYILKAHQMCKGTFNPFYADPLPVNPKKQLILKVISGQQLPKPPDFMFGDRGKLCMAK